MEAAEPSCRNSQQPGFNVYGERHPSARSALSEAAGPGTSAREDRLGATCPAFNPAVSHLDHGLPLMCVCPVDTTLKRLLQEALPFLNVLKSAL